MTTFNEKAWEIQTRIERSFKLHVEAIKAHRRTKNLGRELPSCREIVKLRSIMIGCVLGCIVIATVNVFPPHIFDYNIPTDVQLADRFGMYEDYPRPFYYGWDVYAEMFSLLFAMFAGICDFSLFKRFGKEFSLFDYS
jgi:hypothetical protein